MKYRTQIGEILQVGMKVRISIDEPICSLVCFSDKTAALVQLNKPGTFELSLTSLLKKAGRLEQCDLVPVTIWQFDHQQELLVVSLLASVAPHYRFCFKTLREHSAEPFDSLYEKLIEATANAGFDFIPDVDKERVREGVADVHAIIRMELKHADTLPNAEAGVES